MEIRAQAGEARVLGWVTVTLILLFLAVRLPVLWIERFNPDEFEALHGSYSIAKGLIPYRDYFENHLPLLHFLLLPLFGLFAADDSSEQAKALILAARVTMWAMSALAIGAVYWVGRLRSGPTQGCVAAVLLCGLTFYADKGFEVRPDVPAHLLLCVCWLTLAAASRIDSMDRRGPLLGLSGASLALATLATQKILFSWPGCFLLAGLVIAAEPGPRRWRSAAFWLGGLALPLVALGAWFAVHGAFASLIDQNLLLNLRWKTRYSPVPVFRAIWFENWPVVLLACLGLLTVWRGSHPRVPASLRLLPLAAAGSLLAGTLILPAPLDQYFLPLMAPLSWLAADALVGLAGRLAPARAFAWSLSAVLVLWLGPELVRMGRDLASTESPARETLDQVGWVIDHTGRDDTVLDGFSGLGVFRPHAWFYFYPNEDIRPLIDYGEVAALVKALQNGRVAPRLAIVDRDLQEVDSDLLLFLKENYEPVGMTEIWERRDDPIDGPSFGGRLDIGSGPLDRLAGYGFYTPEEEDGHWFRRSRGRASTLRVPLQRGDHSRLVVHARLEYPLPGVSMLVSVNDRQLAAVPLEEGWRDYVLPIPASLLRAGLNRVQLLYPLTPRDTQGTTGRNAVIALDQIRIE